MIKISDVTATNGSPIIQVNSSESLVYIVAGNNITLEGFLPEQILSADNTAKTITLVEDWGNSTSTNNKAVVQEVVSRINEAVESIDSLVTRSNQYVSQWDAMTNNVTTVTVTGPDDEVLTLSSIPKIIQDATSAGDTLYQEVQASITLLGNLPAQAQAVQDSVDIFNPKYTEWETNSPTFLDNYVSINSSIATFTSTTLPAANQASSDAETAKTAAEVAQLAAEAARDDAVDISGGYVPITQVTGLRSELDELRILALAGI